MSLECLTKGSQSSFLSTPLIQGKEAQGGPVMSSPTKHGAPIPPTKSSLPRWRLCSEAGQGKDPGGQHVPGELAAFPVAQPINRKGPQLNVEKFISICQ